MSDLLTAYAFHRFIEQAQVAQPHAPLAPLIERIAHIVQKEPLAPVRILVAEGLVAEGLDRPLQPCKFPNTPPDPRYVAIAVDGGMYASERTSHVSLVTLQARAAVFPPDDLFPADLANQINQSVFIDNITDPDIALDSQMLWTVAAMRLALLETELAAHVSTILAHHGYYPVAFFDGSAPTNLPFLANTKYTGEVFEAYKQRFVEAIRNLQNANTVLIGYIDAPRYAQFVELLKHSHSTSIATIMGAEDMRAQLLKDYAIFEALCPPRHYTEAFTLSRQLLGHTYVSAVVMLNAADEHPHASPALARAEICTLTKDKSVHAQRYQAALAILSEQITLGQHYPFLLAFVHHRAVIHEQLGKVFEHALLKARQEYLEKWVSPITPKRLIKFGIAQNTDDDYGVFMR